jgi:putative two-component system response regulator
MVSSVVTMGNSSLTNGFHQCILIVDDDPVNLRFLERLLGHAGYKDIVIAGSGKSALEVSRQRQPDLIILDLQMPEIDGYEVLSTLRNSVGSGVYVPILVYTADVTYEARKRALELGASDFLTKPGDAQEILLRVKNFLVVRALHLALTTRNENLENMVRERTHELEASQVEIIERLAQAGERRDDDTGEHTQRVGELSGDIAEAMCQPTQFVRLIRLTARLHDLGKIGVPDSILLKPGRLTPDEFKEMQLHCAAGARILSGGLTPLLQMAERIAQSHHERFDGTGYPDGLVGAAIPIEARIVAVADVFDALTHSRPYKVAWNVADAVTEIRAQSGRHFDPKIVEAFLTVISLPQVRQTHG